MELNVTAEVTSKGFVFKMAGSKIIRKRTTKLIQDLSMEECSIKLKELLIKAMSPQSILRPIRDKVRNTYQLIESHLNKGTPLDQKIVIR